MNCLYIFLKRYGWLLAIILICTFFPMDSAKAEKSISLSAGSSTVEIDKTLEVPITIDTEGEAINAIGFTVDFSTENLDGLVPNRSGSAFSFWAVETATRIDCGVPGQTGFSGAGLITTLRFKGRTEGEVNISLRNIKVLFAGQVLTGYAPNDINITVISSGATPPPAPIKKEKVSVTPPSATTSTALAPTNSTPVVQTPSEIPSPAQTFGSLAQVKGTKGATAEEILQPAAAATASVKGLFSGQSIFWTGILPTTILIIVIIFLGMRLYFNERKRHLNMERIFDKQLGTLAALESKVDILDQGGALGKEKYIAELETAKKEIILEAGTELKPTSNLSGETQPGTVAK